MQVIVPYTPERPKSRLGDLLSANERQAFARAMLGDVLAALEPIDVKVTVLSTAPLFESVPVTVRVDDRPLSPAVEAAIQPPTAVVMADVALATTEALRDTFDRNGDVVIAPGRGGGTNVLVVRDETFEVDYHGNSLGDHRAIAAANELEVTEVDSFRLATDVDEPADIVEVLLHTDGRAATWLRERGIRLAVGDGRVTVTRRARG